MIALLRKRLQGPLYQGILWATLFSLLGVTAFTGLFRRFSGLPATAVADVNGYEISAVELRRKAQEEERYFQYLKQLFGESAQTFLDSQGLQGSPVERALDALIRQKLILSLADSLGIRLAPDYAAQQFAEPMFRYQILGELVPPQLLVGESLDQQQLVRALQRQGISIADLESMIETTLKDQVAMGLAQGALYIPEQALKDKFMRDYRAKQYSMVTLPLLEYEKNMRSTKPLSEDELQSFFKQHSELGSYWIPEKRNALLWTFEPSTYGLTVTEPEIEQYYANNKHRFIAQPATTDDQGVTTSEAVYKELKEVAPDIKETIINEKFRRLFTGEAQRTLAQAAENTTGLTTFIENKKGQRSILENQEKSQAPIAARLFELKHIGQRGVVTQGNQGIIIELSDKKEAYLPEFESVKKQVEQDLYRSLAQQEISKGLDAMKSMSPQEAVKYAQQHGGSLEKTGLIKSEDGQWASWSKQGMPTEAMKAMVTPEATAISLSDKAGYYVLLNDIESFEPALFDQHQREIWRSLYREELQSFIEGLIASLYKNATIKVNATLAHHY